MWKKWFSKKTNKIVDDTLYGALDPDKIPKHVAIIMDGNGRWAQRKGLPRALGHRAGVDSLRKIVNTASDIGVGTLTVYGFSTENWNRPPEEVDLLMKLISEYIDSEIDELHSDNIKMQFIGKIAELPDSLQRKIERAQTRTGSNTGLIFNLAVNYGGRAEIVRAVQIIAQEVVEQKIKPEDITELVINQHLYTADLPDPELLIRPSGDFRISNFLLWQLAYTEFWFTDTNWPDFEEHHLIDAICDYQKRERRFGGLKK